MSVAKTDYAWTPVVVKERIIPTYHAEFTEVRSHSNTGDLQGVCSASAVIRQAYGGEHPKLTSHRNMPQT